MRARQGGLDGPGLKATQNVAEVRWRRGAGNGFACSTWRSVDRLVRSLEGVLKPRAEWKPLGLGKYYGGGEVKLVG